MGLGKYVVEGERSYRFCPKYPTLINYTTNDLVKNSQVEFFAVDMLKHDINLLEGDEAGLARLDMFESEKHGTLKHCVSVFNPENNSLTPGLSQSGPRVVNFANILKYNYVPLSQTIQVVLDIVKEALGAACEIEFAVDLNRDTNYKSSFFLLQIKPMMGNTTDYKVNLDDLDLNKVVLLSRHGMGNGYINSIADIVYIRKEAFDKTATPEMANDVNFINSKLIEMDRKCILIGPGRWGTRDRWIGIPVTWPQISQAKIVVETSFEDFPLDASYGSHFFHNVISMNVGYCSIHDADKTTKIDWDILNSLPAITETKFFRHVQLPKPMIIRMDGRQRLIVASIE